MVEGVAMPMLAVPSPLAADESDKAREKAHEPTPAAVRVCGDGGGARRFFLALGGHTGTVQMCVKALGARGASGARGPTVGVRQWLHR